MICIQCEKEFDPKDSPSDDFCRENCQRAWGSAQVGEYVHVTEQWTPFSWSPVNSDGVPRLFGQDS